jgi:hypothetical protein
MGAVLEVKYFNTFLLKKTISNPPEKPVWNGSFGIPQSIGGYSRAGSNLTDTGNWAIEESRIRGGYNNTTVDFGVKAYLVEDEPNASNRINSMIYSGIFNSRTGINQTNVFSVGEDITKSVDPANGSIQKLYAENSRLIIFQERKVSGALIDKDAIYSAEGGGIVTSSNSVIGAIQPYSGDYGISKNPESFAVYGYQKYFSDANKNVILRLSNNGITEISAAGMVDYFRDEINSFSVPSFPARLIGGYDIHNKQYVISIQKNIQLQDNTFYQTLSFDERVSGWVSFFNYKPDQIFSLRNKTYTLKDAGVWQHYAVRPTRFYGTTYQSSITFVLNPEPEQSKSFYTIGYEGTNGWQVNSITSDLTGSGPDIENQGSGWISTSDKSSLIRSYTTGAYDSYGNEYPATLFPPLSYAGFNRKENKYVASIINASNPNEAEVAYGDQISGIKGNYVTVTMQTDGITDNEGVKELFSVSSKYTKNSGYQ